MRIGWRRWLAGGILALAGLTAPLDLLAPDDLVASIEADLRQALKEAKLDSRPFLDSFHALPGYAEASRESGWRAETRQSHRLLESARTLAASLGALALAFGILRRRPWAPRLLGAGLLLWTALYAFDLRDGQRFLGDLPWLFASGQGLNLLCLSGLWLWLRKG